MASAPKNNIKKQPFFKIVFPIRFFPKPFLPRTLFPKTCFSKSFFQIGFFQTCAIYILLDRVGMPKEHVFIHVHELTKHFETA